MTKKLGTASTIVAVAGFLAIYAESKLGFSNGTLIGIGLLGVAAILWGIEEILKREAYVAADNQESGLIETFRGVAAAMSGLVLLLIGIALVVSSILGLSGLGNFALEFIKNRPGILLIFLGALGIAYSFQLIVGSPQSNNGFWKIIASVPARLFGIFIFLLGLGLIFSGIFEVFLPDRFQQIFQSLIQYFSPPAFL